MSKIGKNPIQLPEGVNVDINGSLLSIKGPKWTSSLQLYPWITAKVEENQIVVICQDIALSSFWGTMRSLISNMVEGVLTGYTQKLQVIGVGFDASIQWNMITFKLGYAHTVPFAVPEGVEAKVEKDPKGNAVITLTSHDKQLIGQTAAQIRALRKPEPYKGKWIRYFNEVVKLKAGKTAKK